MRGETATMLEEFGLWARLGVLPDAGGLRDQDAVTVAALALLSDERAAIERLQMREQQEAGKHGRSSGSRVRASPPRDR